jgi:superfamily II DNA or RNA helicase
VILGGEPAVTTLGTVTLHSHQRAAVELVMKAIDQFNGALLCDEVGMGKTYVAIAIARRFQRRLVVTPAALIPMWTAALRATATEAESITFEALSRRDSQSPGRPPSPLASHDLVIVDEAHHVRNPRTNRYFALESVVRGAKVLLLSATPIHNRREDLVALLALFLGSRARALTTGELALCVVRREQRQLEQSTSIPAIRPTISHRLPDDPSLVEQLLVVPAPIPVRDGGLAGALIGRGLVHQWASSEAALREAIRRRLARTSALCASLEAGTYPTARELETWIYCDGTLQLGFAELLSAPVVDHREMLVTMRTHLDALQSIQQRLSSATLIDAQRGRIVAAIRSAHRDSRIVAFAQYAESVSMLFRRLALTGRVAMLTSHGARVAGGSLTRQQAIDRFAPCASGARKPSPAEEIDLLLTTDLLSEGVNLQDADVVIHLDIPWTVARMEQRVGRVVRLGSRHPEVTVHLLQPPHSAERVLRSEAIIQHKWRLAKSEIGSGTAIPPLADADISVEADEVESTPEKAELLRSILQRWITTGPADSDPAVDLSSETVLVATVHAKDSGFIAAVSVQGSPKLLVQTSHQIATDLATQIAACTSASTAGTPTDLNECAKAIESVADWFAHEKASTAAGLAASSPLRRRELTARIDAAIESAPPHLRASRLIVAARAREVATIPQCAAIERELETLLRSDLPSDDWLQAVAALETTADRLNQTSTSPLTIHAILLLRDRC